MKVLDLKWLKKIWKGYQREASLWFKDVVIYQLHVRAFSDSNADGIGDFRGLISRLDYLKELGIEALWLLPFYPSPLRDDGYDISNYTDVHPAYGTLEDFKDFLQEAHQRGIRVITELVLNHTSDQHPWFQKERQSVSLDPLENFYVWNGTPEKYGKARIIFKDFENSNWAWDSTAKKFYWHRFYSHQPDLNYDNPKVHEAIFQIADFWLRLGVDGLRLDAVPYLYEREGTNCENLPETHEFLKKLRQHVDSHFHDRVLLAEVNQPPEKTLAYFGSGEECHMLYHFPVMPKLFLASHMEDSSPILDILEDTATIPGKCQWAIFLRNHDELTLEMITDVERECMYEAYAQDMTSRLNLGIRRRFAPLLGNSRKKIELMYGLLFSLAGTPIIYYGDEIGMGDNTRLGDRNGLRTPMQWDRGKNAGFSSAESGKLYLPVITDPEYHYEVVNVEAQQNNPDSLLQWIKNMVLLRDQFRTFGRGQVRFISSDNKKILAYTLRYQEEVILVVVNLSRSVEYGKLDLRAYAGVSPMELIGRTEFPPVADSPYLLTMSPQTFYWFLLSKRPLENHTQQNQG